MKVRSQAAAAALAVAGVSAQAGYPAESPLSYTTVTYNDCPTASIETMITVTEGVTATYCPKCHHDESSGIPTPTKHTTVYTTVYQSVCETGLAPVTHTITETCEGPEPTWTHGPDYVPPGFTTTVKECGGCKGAMPTKPVLVTITEPCDCEATSGTAVGPTPTGPPGQYPPPGGDNGGDNGSTPPKPSGGDDSGNPPPGGNVPTRPGVTAPTAAPYPTPSTTVKCPGPECVATGSSGLPPPAGETGVTPPPYQGAASSYGQFGFAALSIVIGTLAFAL
ncbi:hypothetical protein CKM354_001273100 [Cercospora kikuchii]|uniref:Uncharacterized protein n=1 Tax=Cercospora kikuchii TaxID=84275 RepID=A0A9P3L1N2_9PEZI|nr:uncharacterized protein CKM354_001273100 [Cercospora kikuchii]GIZ49704.1 hypothetical protein CKM354_001273100 [Cercospora kikuchii]